FAQSSSADAADTTSNNSPADSDPTAETQTADPVAATDNAADNADISSNDQEPRKLTDQEILDALDYEPDLEEHLEDEIINDAGRIAILEDQLARSQAEFINFRNRNKRETQELGDVITASLVEKLLPVLDDLDRMQEAGDTVPPTLTKFREILESWGVQSFGDVGEPFDPAVHEAVLSNPKADLQVDTVSAIAAKGYKLRDRVIRPAKVVVDKAEV
ncbi:MAG: nucleotide exchange factor GrpE, partial [Bifidobacteriaceae bacterium]|nr:nucleotide exchange factor GrpE [Bifidobacteriaceae bacterium]